MQAKARVPRGFRDILDFYVIESKRLITTNRNIIGTDHSLLPPSKRPAEAVSSHRGLLGRSTCSAMQFKHHFIRNMKGEVSTGCTLEQQQKDTNHQHARPAP